jgi:heptosyltransferase-1
MKILLVKTSSLGDVIHTLPALTDAMQSLSGVQFDWVLEERFTQLPECHPVVKKVIPMAWRRWRKTLWKVSTWKEIFSLSRALKSDGPYDMILDAQGLLKSAMTARLARGPRGGYDRRSVRESIASWFYQVKASVPKGQHAIDRNRQLFSKVLGYALPTTVADYGLDRSHFQKEKNKTPTLLFFHSTTWDSKHWPESYWQTLATLCCKQNIGVKLAWGNAEECARAKRIQAEEKAAEILPDLDLQGLITEIANASAIVGVDTGLSHLTAALGVPSVTLYGPTDAKLTGTQGGVQINLSPEGFACAPCLNRECQYKGASSVSPACFSSMTPDKVFEKLLSRVFC